MMDKYMAGYWLLSCFLGMVVIVFGHYSNKDKPMARKFSWGLGLLVCFAVPIYLLFIK